MTEKEKSFDLWDSIGPHPPSISKDLFLKNTRAFLELLIDKTQRLDKFEISFSEESGKGFSCLGYPDITSKKHIEMRLRKNDSYEMILTIEDFEGEIQTFRSKLSTNEIKLIPRNIQNLMYKVREIGRPVTFFNTITE
jgi:hypothetical protein